ncbi:MAG: hypothetical protein AB7H90_01250 [Alphaproteobacteria bacterium]
MNVRANLNDYVKVRLTDMGRKIWHDAWAPHSRDGTGLDHMVSADGVLQGQLWQMMSIFGPEMCAGFDGVFVGTEIVIENAKTEATAWFPMETAPKDGKPILLWVCPTGSIRRGRPELCWWGTHKYWGETWLRHNGKEVVGSGVALLWQPIVPPDGFREME